MESIDFLDDLDALSLDFRLSLLHSCFQQSNYSRTITEAPDVFCDKMKPDFVKLKNAVRRFRSISDIRRSWVHLDELSRALVRWFATSTPMRHQKEPLSFLPSPTLHEVIDCHHFFSIHRPQSNSDFTNAKREYGSVIAYHGSPTYNWHAIIEQNLQNYSNTKQMTSGALYGEGIYLTSAISLSRQFSKMCPSWSESKLGTSLACVGVFEIAMHPEYVRSDKVKESNKNKSLLWAADDVKIPKHYYVVKDNRYLEMKGIVMWGETKKAKEKKTKIGCWMILVYAVVLLALFLSQMKWQKVKKQTWRYFHHFMD